MTGLISYSQRRYPQSEARFVLVRASSRSNEPRERNLVVQRDAR